MERDRMNFYYMSQRHIFTLQKISKLLNFNAFHREITIT